jgi:prepilin-type N-terminal cleavage/methylation domain-containing protein
MRGFTFIEIILVMGIMAILAGFAVPLYGSLRIRNDLTVATNTTVQLLNRAQTLARAMREDDAWGVSVVSGEVTLFRGSDFATRITTFDEVFKLPGGITSAGNVPLYFEKFSATPRSGVAVPPLSITLTAPSGSANVITIESTGVIRY